MLGLILYYIAIMVIGFKIYQKLTHQTFTSEDTMTDKVVIVTGANTGIGYATALDLSRRGARVILACRDASKGMQATAEIRKINCNIVYKHLDLASFKSVRSFVKDVLENETRLDVLINNAGTGILDNSLTEDNLPIEAQVNYFSPFLLTISLLPLLKSSAPSRIINVSSIMHKFGTVKDLDKQATSFFGLRRVYSNTKLANILFTRKLSDHLRGTGVTVNCLHPGAVSTDIFRNQPKLNRYIVKLLFLSPEEGAQTSIYLSVAKSVENVSGKYFSNCAETSPGLGGQDDDAGETLWELSNDIVFR